MTEPIQQSLRQKQTFRVGNRKLVLIKKPMERWHHVVMKALLWALYLPDYPDLQVEISIGHRYKPDLVQTGPDGPRFWGEAGHIGEKKLAHLLQRFPNTHFALAIWAGNIGHFDQRVVRRMKTTDRRAPVDLICFPAGADRRFIDARGNMAIGHADLQWRRIAPTDPPPLLSTR